MRFNAVIGKNEEKYHSTRADFSSSFLRFEMSS